MTLQLDVFALFVAIGLHVQAESNVQGVLVSDPKDGVPSFGLVKKGEQQAKEVGHEGGKYGLNIRGVARIFWKG